MARLKYFLLDPKSKIETPIFLSITYSGKRVKLKTRQKVKPRAWNKNSNSIRTNWTEYSDVQIELDRIHSTVKDKLNSILDEHKSLPQPKELKKILGTVVFLDEKSMENSSFWEFFDFFKNKLPKKKSSKTGRPISKGTIQSYTQLYKILQDFERDTGNVITFLTINNKTYHSLIDYLEENKEFTPNTVGKHIKNFKVLINEARNTEGIKISDNYNKDYWKVYKEVKVAEEIVFLSEEELKKLAELDLVLGSVLDMSRDVFLVGAWTALRISDIARLSDGNIHEYNSGAKYIHIHTQKTDKQVTIPLHPIILMILDKYDGKMPRVSEPVVNKNIKSVCRKIDSLKKTIVRVKETKAGKVTYKDYKKYQKITTHTARRSFASNMFKRDVPVRQIMAVTGHKKEADFFRYIGISNHELIKNLNDSFNEWFQMN